MDEFVTNKLNEVAKRLKLDIVHTPSVPSSSSSLSSSTLPSYIPANSILKLKPVTNHLSSVKFDPFPNLSSSSSFSSSSSTSSSLNNVLPTQSTERRSPSPPINFNSFFLDGDGSEENESDREVALIDSRY